MTMSPKFTPDRPESPPEAGTTTPQGRGVERWEVGAEYAGQRIDNFLLSRLKGVPKTRIYKMLRTGEVRVNGGRIASDYRVREGDQLRIPPVRVSERALEGGQSQSTGGVSAARAHGVAKSIPIVLEDDLVLAIDKPFGLAVHGGSGVALGVIEALRASRSVGVTGRDSLYLELVHRLDRETSGLMLLAKRRSSLTELHRQLREGEMRKRYLALVWGSWPPACDRVEAPLHKWVNAKGERWVRVDPQGQAAITKVKVLQRVTHAEFGAITLLQCEPLTGRTHQLRVHLAHQGHPIVGDPKYGDHARDGQWPWIKRMFLHAWQLRFLHPGRQEKLSLTADIPVEFQHALTHCGLERP